MTRQIIVGGVAIGGGAPVTVQTMTNTDTRDVSATLAQIKAAADAGADIVCSPRSCDICLCETFDTLASLEAYRTHPVHLPVQAHMHAVMERSQSADYEVPTA